MKDKLKGILRRRRIVGIALVGSVVILLIIAASGHARVLVTGQKQCWDPNGNPIRIDCKPDVTDPKAKGQSDR